MENFRLANNTIGFLDDGTRGGPRTWNCFLFLGKHLWCTNAIRSFFLSGHNRVWHSTRWTIQAQCETTVGVTTLHKHHKNLRKTFHHMYALHTSPKHSAEPRRGVIEACWLVLVPCGVVRCSSILASHWLLARDSVVGALSDLGRSAMRDSPFSLTNSKWNFFLSDSFTNLLSRT